MMWIHILFAYQNMYIILKIQLLHLKLDFITLHQRVGSSAVGQGFLQLDDIGSQHDPHWRIIGGHRETLEGHNIHMLQNKG